ncbi:MAG: hypothetical protein ABF785_08775 [Acetobacter papayae]|uniref:hypothetical protein n=1 Tax=Acetobacter papayae TaxID=1076592 RepID=UPI0039ECE64B
MKILISILCFLMFLPKIANAATSAQDLYNQCSEDFFVSSDIVVCLAKKLAASEKRLVKEQQHAVAVLDQWHVDPEYKEKAREKFLENNKEFKKYKKYYCNFSMSMMGGSESNSHEISRISCVASQNLYYIEQVEENLRYIRKK